MAEDASAPWAVMLAEVAAALALLGAEGWLTGGCLRDALLGVPPRDVDLAVTCEPAALARALRRERSFTIAALKRDSLRLGVRGAGGEPPLQLDVSPLVGGSAAADLARRDFTVNALALPLSARDEFITLLRQGDERSPAVQAPPSLLDPLGGLADLRAHRIVPASGHALADDPGRLLRAAHLAARFGFTPTQRLLDAAGASAPSVPSLSSDRLRDELNAVLELPLAADGLDLLAQMGVLSLLFPTLGVAGGVLAHALASVRAAACLRDVGGASPGMEPLAALAPLRSWLAAPLSDGLPRMVALRWGLLLHAPLPHARSNAPDENASHAAMMAGELRVSPAGSARRIAWAVALHGHAARISDLAADRTLRRARFFFEQHGDAGVDVIAAAAACNAALAVAPLGDQRYSPAIAAAGHHVLGVCFADRERLIPPRLLTGTDLMRELGIVSGPALGALLRQVRHAQLDGKVRTREEALAWARTQL